MNYTINYLNLDLALFDGEGGSSSTGSMGSGDSTGQDAAADSGDLGFNDGDAGTSGPTPEERRKAWKDLVSNEYKDFYTEDTQKMIDRRFKETKKMEKQLSEQSEIMAMLYSKHGVSEGNYEALRNAIENDDSYWEDAAYERGMSVDQYKLFSKLERQNAQLIKEQEEAKKTQLMNRQIEKWHAESEEIKKTFPNFSLETEIQNEEFVNLLEKGIPLEHAFKLLHMDEINSELMRTTAKQTEKRVVDNLRSKRGRPAENGSSSQSGFTTVQNVHTLTKEQRLELAKKAERGEYISFS